MNWSTWLRIKLAGIFQTNETNSLNIYKSIDAYCNYGSVDDSPKLYHISGKSSCGTNEWPILDLQLGSTTELVC
eukprot:6389741-Heterocapsa_arctica.AAC.1